MVHGYHRRSLRENDLGGIIRFETKSGPLASSVGDKPGEILTTFAYDALQCHQILQSPTDQYYRHSAFEKLNPTNRGRMFGNMVKYLWERMHGEVLSAKKVQDETDCHLMTFMTALMILVSKKNKLFWFYEVKSDEFDDLVLLFYFPDRVDFYLWRGTAGIQKNGKCENFGGFNLRFYYFADLHDKLRFCCSPGVLFASIDF